VSTLNRSPCSFAAHVALWPRVLVGYPAAGHDWRLYVTPAELETAAAAAGLQLEQRDTAALLPTFWPRLSALGREGTWHGVVGASLPTMNRRQGRLVGRAAARGLIRAERARVDLVTSSPRWCQVATYAAPHEQSWERRRATELNGPSRRKIDNMGLTKGPLHRGRWDPWGALEAAEAVAAACPAHQQAFPTALLTPLPTQGISSRCGARRWRSAGPTWRGCTSRAGGMGRRRRTSRGSLPRCAWRTGASSRRQTRTCSASPRNRTVEP
jgi:hypothetical protein